MDAVAEAPETTRDVVLRALEEDRVTRDLSSLAVVPDSGKALGRLESKDSGVLSGSSFAAEAFLICDPCVAIEWEVEDGHPIQRGTLLATVSGTSRGLLAAERTALNFLSHLSGIATQVSRSRAEVGSVAVLHTRKTLPGLRDAQRQAVLAGGGVLHRRDLSDEVLLKENHFALSGRSFEETVFRAVERHPESAVGVEAESVEQALWALRAGAEYVLLDDFSSAELGPAVSAIRSEYPNAVLEVSGGRAPGGLGELEKVGVNRVSMGSLTHSVRSLDISLTLEPIH